MRFRRAAVSFCAWINDYVSEAMFFIKKQGGFGCAAAKVGAERSVRRRTVAHPTMTERRKVPAMLASCVAAQFIPPDLDFKILIIS
jgi:hypothetical protein